LRVIAGTAKRIQLQTIEGLDTRPTTDRIKETLFNIIAPDIFGSCFLDLFSGSGAIGIEALSRGAKAVTFVEQNVKAISCIEANLKKTHLEEAAEVLHTDVLHAIRNLSKHEKFDYIYMDPPYHQLLEKAALEEIACADILKDTGVLVIEAGKGTDFSYLEELGYLLVKTKVYKTNMHAFISKRGKEEIC